MQSSYLFSSGYAAEGQQVLRQLGLHYRTGALCLSPSSPNPWKSGRVETHVVERFDNHQAQKNKWQQGQYDHDLAGFNNRRHFHVSTLNRHHADVCRQHHGRFLCSNFLALRGMHVPE
jgi:hypothetical protein